jgi:hypothetical protein
MKNGLKMIIVFSIGLILFVTILKADNHLDDARFDNRDPVLSTGGVGKEGEIEKILKNLPHEVSVGKRTVVIDSNPVSSFYSSEYSITEPPYRLLPGENPREFLERYLNELLSEDFVIQHPPLVYQYKASLYRDDEFGLVARVWVDNLPNNDVVSEEDSFIFSYLSGRWELDRYSKRILCKGSGGEYWQPATSSCS